MLTSLSRELRDLSHVPRWAILRLNGSQSVAEHSYYVTLYAVDIAEHVLGWTDKMLVKLVWEALWHDVEESWTGDTPGPAKRELHRQDASSIIRNERYRRFGHTPSDDYRVLDVLKVADLIDECMFLASEMQLGNRAVRAVYEKCRERLVKAWLQMSASVRSRQHLQEVLLAITREVTDSSRVNECDIDLREESHGRLVEDPDPALRGADGGPEAVPPATEVGPFPGAGARQDTAHSG